MTEISMQKMIVSTYLSTESILIDPKVTDKGDVIRMLASCLPGLGADDQIAVTKAVLEREEVMSTGVGNGIAIPHAKVTFLAEPKVAFARLGQPVDFGSIDGKLVDLVFLVTGSNQSNSQHLKILSALSRVLMHKNVADVLRNCKTADEILVSIQQAENYAVQY